MGYRELDLTVPLEESDQHIRKLVARTLRSASAEFSYVILRKSLDARKKTDLHWTVRVGVTSPAIKQPAPEIEPPLVIPRPRPGAGATPGAGARNGGRVVVVGNGPAGFFAALVLQTAGCSVTLIDRGTEVDERATRIEQFETTGRFDPLGNYAFGEGGAGTFSYGKLTSRTKRISREKGFVLSSFVDAGAPQEIRYLAHPHVGSDNLRTVVRNLSRLFRERGGTTLFETALEDLSIRDGVVREAITSRGSLDAEHFVIAPGHSAYDTYRMLSRRGVQFRNKGFALGCRVEHPQALINEAQWGFPEVAGLGAAEYRLSSVGDGVLPVYTFCMCPGGTIVPAAATADTNIVNGMSLFARDGRHANAGCLASLSPQMFFGEEASPAATLDWLEAIERSFAEYAPGFRAPACGIEDFISRREPGSLRDSSYPLGLAPAPLWELLPAPVTSALTCGLKDFARSIRGFESGTIMGLESKSSAPIQVVRGEGHLCVGFTNLSVIGEGSGFAGGIISSAVDGIKCAMEMIAQSGTFRPVRAAPPIETGTAFGQALSVPAATSHSLAVNPVADYRLETPWDLRLPIL